MTLDDLFKKLKNKMNLNLNYLLKLTIKTNFDDIV